MCKDKVLWRDTLKKLSLVIDCPIPSDCQTVREFIYFRLNFIWRERVGYSRAFWCWCWSLFLQDVKILKNPYGNMIEWRRRCWRMSKNRLKQQKKTTWRSNLRPPGIWWRIPKKGRKGLTNQKSVDQSRKKGIWDFTGPNIPCYSSTFNTIIDIAVSFYIL